MVYTITLNPCIDYAVYANSWEVGKVNRTGKGRSFAGGKGINVSIVLTNLKCPNVAFGFVGGYTGKEIERLVKSKGVKTEFVKIQDESRINVKVLGKNETQFNGAGPNIEEKDVSLLFKQLSRLKSGDYLVLSGSVPHSLSPLFYCDILQYVDGKGVKVIVDTTGESLIRALKFKPFLIKPNHHELAEIFGVSIETKEDIIKYANKLVELGAQNVIVSMGGEGAVYTNNEGALEYIQAPKGKVVDTVGAGDSMVAGFLAGIDKGQEYALRLSCAAGGATAFSKGLATRENIDKLMEI